MDTGNPSNPRQRGQHLRNYFVTREQAYKYAIVAAKKKAPNTSVSIRKTLSMRRRQTPWIVSVDQH